MASAKEDCLLDTTAHASFDDHIYWLQLGHLQGVDREIERFAKQQISEEDLKNQNNVSDEVKEVYQAGNDEAEAVENVYGSKHDDIDDNRFELVRAELFFLRDCNSDASNCEEELSSWNNNSQIMGNLQTGEKKHKGVGGSGGGGGDGSHGTTDAASSVAHLGMKEKSSGSPRIMRMFSSGGKKNVSAKTPVPVKPEVTQPIAPSQSTHSQISQATTTFGSTSYATPPSKEENNSDTSDGVFVDILPTTSPSQSAVTLRSEENLIDSIKDDVLDLAQITLFDFNKPSGLADTSSENAAASTLLQSPTTTNNKTRNGSLLPNTTNGNELKSWEERISSALVSGYVSHARRQDNNGRNLIGSGFTNSPASVFSGRIPSETEVIAEAEEEQMGGTNGTALEMTTNSTTNNNCRSHAFTISKHKKINLSPSTSPSSSTPATPATAPPAIPPVDGQASCGSLRRHSSYGDVPLGESSNVLRKVASLTLDRATIEEKVNKPKFVPEKLDFKIYEKFEGQMLLNWFCSAFTEGHYLNNIIKHDLKIIGVQFCTHLLACGVLQQIEDLDAPLEPLFKPDRMYYWTHLEVPATAAVLPGKIQESTKSLFLAEKFEDISPTLKLHTAVNDVCQETKSFEEIEVLKTNYKQELERIQKDNEAAIVRIQIERTTEADSLREKIEQLERDVEKYKTLADIQLLTRQVNDDFSPTALAGQSLANGSEITSKIEPAQPPTGGPPPPPPMLGMGPPPPPPMPGMGPPPPPPMPGMGPPPPPPMPGMGPPPPPPMPGMGPPPPPPMSGMGPPPPPPMPGSGPPPPPMPGSLPPPPPMPGMGPPPPPPMFGAKSNGGPAPFPPPPPGGWGGEPQMRKQPINPKVPMKPLYWTRIQLSTTASINLPQDRKNSIWEKLDEVNLETMDDFIDLFSRQVVEKKVATKTKVVKTSKVESAKLLDSKRAQMVGILVSSHHLEIAEVENAVYNFDTSVLDLDALQAIHEVRATEEELKLISQHLSANPEVPLDKPEQFLYELSQIPHFADRIACFTFQSTFNENLTAIENKLNNMEMTCDFLMKSEDVKNVLCLVLTLGNYMNGGNRQRGQADGFAIEILSKLRDVKSKDGSFTLLHYIVKVFVKKYDNNAGTEKAKLPVPEPSDVEKASHVKFDDIDVDLRKLNKELQDCKKRAAKVIEVSDVGHLQPFKSKMEEFFEKGGAELKEQETNLKSCIDVFDRLIKCYQWQPKAGDDPQPKDFFHSWITFCVDFKDMWKKEQQKVFKEKMDTVVKKKTKEIQTVPKEKTGLKWRLTKKH